ncbi:bifunctional riboflavin kinase/FAD synthetase [Blochmannia endosymbiont of Colobopsis nipponica]|uniref:bifunctional riboflavin kinase/FAD synthetase n=1 Tax=Blochmannia endosymbiont of Colobopsis nipponica TaxID=2681987 RepID=UPI0017807432|nr:bifunctional riboflavin kinase/FAD synthetase [Blochmannia endosymbiont of Colobopsis nipponica]QOI11289.1 bifunctional riboflavin kinase/FAD synthetase [Blochmannia endosymbiont of Colobopsis nipponica]
MELIRGVHNLKLRHRGCALTIGNFDGFHRGHQFLISCLQTECYKRNLRSMVMIFEPQPQEFFIGDKIRLANLRNKLKYLANAKIDMVLCVAFNKKFSKIGAYTFINKLLINKLNVRLICIGGDFCFGVNRRGNSALLHQFSKNAGFEVISIVTCIEEGQRISSSAVRIALMQDRLTDAEVLLGHPYCISGRVVHGNALGKTIGFPTANILLKGYQLPIRGVYIVKIYGIMKDPLPGLANIGLRPTVLGSHQEFEVHLLDVTLNLYGIYLDVVICSKMRDEKTFISLEKLKDQIRNDVLSARNYFGL